MYPIPYMPMNVSIIFPGYLIQPACQNIYYIKQTYHIQVPIITRPMYTSHQKNFQGTFLAR